MFKVGDLVEPVNRLGEVELGEAVSVLSCGNSGSKNDLVYVQTRYGRKGYYAWRFKLHKRPEHPSLKYLKILRDSISGGKPGDRDIWLGVSALIKELEGGTDANGKGNNGE